MMKTHGQIKLAYNAQVVADGKSGLIVAEAADGKLEHFPILGWLSAAATISSLWLAGRLRPVTAEVETTTTQAVAAAAEAMYDAAEPLM